MTPAYPGSGIIRPKIDEKRVEKSKQDTYRSVVGTLLYLIKHSRPDISNCVRELSNVLDSCTMGDYKCMFRAVKFVKQTRFKGLKMNPVVNKNEVWYLNAYVDSDWAGDTEMRKRVSGWDLYLEKCLIGWGSRAQKTVSISSSTAEYVAITDVCKEVLFVKNIMQSLGLVLDYPIIIHCDNVGALYMAKNNESRRTKYLDTQYHFVREYVEDGVVKIIFVHSEDNRVDPYTKNVSEPIYKKNVECLINYR